MRKDNPSGHLTPDLLRKAGENFYEIEGRAFRFDDCVETLMIMPKFSRMTEPINVKKNWEQHEAGDDIVCPELEGDDDDDDGEEKEVVDVDAVDVTASKTSKTSKASKSTAMGSLLKRPPGSKAAKKERKDDQTKASAWKSSAAASNKLADAIMDRNIIAKEMLTQQKREKQIEQLMKMAEMHMKMNKEIQGQKLLDEAYALMAQEVPQTIQTTSQLTESHADELTGSPPGDEEQRNGDEDELIMDDDEPIDNRH